jgi:hypothetical protein
VVKTAELILPFCPCCSVSSFLFPFLFLPFCFSADEKNYRSDMKSTFESGARWEKVNKLLSTQPKVGEKPGQSRVERMRKLLIQLKAEKKA